MGNCIFYTPKSNDGDKNQEDQKPTIKGQKARVNHETSSTNQENKKVKR